MLNRRLDPGAGNVLAYMDQGSFLALRALGRQPLIQVLWIYERGLDFEGLHRFQRNLGHGLLGRSIEKSPLPFGRHRWVADTSPADLQIDVGEVPRNQVWEWADTRIRLPIDPELGPGWHLGVVPLSTGGAAVSLVASHSLVDGVGLCLAVADAVQGDRRHLGYPARGTRTRKTAMLQDIGTTVRYLPATVRGLAAATRTARSFNDGPLPVSMAGSHAVNSRFDDPITPPTATAWIGADQWDLRTEELGGKHNSLFVGFAARLASTLGRVSGDRRVHLSLPVSDRVDGDTRANALTAMRVSVDPELVTTTLAEVRTDLKTARRALPATSADLLTAMALVPFTPKALVRHLEARVGAIAEVGCSYLGDLDPAVNRPDGNDADLMAARSLEPAVTPATLDRMNGHLFVGGGRVHGRTFITVSAWVPGVPNSGQQLREWVHSAVEDMGLTATVE